VNDDGKPARRLGGPVGVAAIAVLLAWATRSVVVEGLAIYGAGAPPAPWSSAAQATQVDPLQGALTSLADRLPPGATVNVAAPTADQPTAEYWATYFLFPRRVRITETPTLDTPGLVIVNAPERPATPAGYQEVVAVRQDPGWLAAFVRVAGP
jgi:hypothetical protein